MDPSLSISSDPHHPPPQFAAFPPFAASNPFAAASAAPPGHPFFGGHVAPAAVAPSNNHVLQPPPNHAAPPPPPPPSAPLPPHPSFNHPPYSDMICSAIAALNEPDGSSKQAISRYIERVYSGLPPAHGALLTHHLKTLKNSGVLVMVKKSYKFASTPPPASVAVAAAAAAAGLEPPRSDLFVNNTANDQPQPDLSSVSASATQKRGRGRPPKPKFEAQPSDIQPNGQPPSEQNDLSVSQPVLEAQQSRRTPGRPKKSVATAALQAAPAAAVMKRRGRPAGRRGRKPKSVSAPVSVFPYAANGVKRRGRPKRVESAAAVVPAAAEGRELAVATPGKRRGRPPKIGGVISKPMKPKRRVSRTGRPVGRPRKNESWAITEISGQQAAEYGELKRRFALLQEKVKEAVNVLKAEVTSENQAVVLAIQELEGVAAMETSEPQPLEEAQPQEPQPQPEAQAQTEAEAMQEALF